MCGVAGILTAPGAAPISLELLRRMIAMLDHRGPDGYGLYRDRTVGLAHSRLSIIDLDTGFQPLSNEDGSVWLSFNGEIFNYLELRKELQARGHRFRSQGDSEVIVHLYEEYGPDAWTRLNGQFAFALWDRDRGRLALVRDRLGILPLHYARSRGCVVFGSEAKALLASGLVDGGIDASAVAEAFARWSAAAPATFFSAVRSVAPGTALWFDTSLAEHEQRYWRLEFSEDPDLSKASVDDAADALEERLTEAVRLRLRADVPVGGYLSGGLDSSVIASLIRTVDTSPLETFAVRFRDPDFDETAEQRRMAALLGTDHHEIVCGGREIVRDLEPVVWHCEAALLRTAPVPLFVLSSLVQRNGMRVVLTGEGADEFFAGYGIFKEDKVRRYWAARPDSQVRPQLFSRVHSEIATGGARDAGIWASFFRRHLQETDDPYYSHLIRWENTSWSQRLLSSEVRDRASFGAPDLPDGWTSWPPLARAQWLEIETFLSPYLLPLQGDRVAMAHGVEVRYPFLDPHVVDLATRLPSRLRMPALRDKIVLRRLAGRRLPSEVARRPKVPYRAPMVTPFVEAPSDDSLLDLLSAAECARYGMVDAAAAGRLVAKARRTEGHLSEREQMAFVGALTLQVLARQFGAAFDARAREARRRLDGWQQHVLEDRVGGTSAPLVEQAR